MKFVDKHFSANKVLDPTSNGQMFEQPYIKSTHFKKWWTAVLPANGIGIAITKVYKWNYRSCLFGPYSTTTTIFARISSKADEEGFRDGNEKDKQFQQQSGAENEIHIAADFA